MFDLGFTMEELMFPENYESNVLSSIEFDCSIDKIDEITSIYENQEQIVLDDDDDWFTIKQLNSSKNLDISSNENNFNLFNDQTLPLLSINSDNYYQYQMKSALEFNDSMFSSNPSIKIVRETSSSSDEVPNRTSLSTITTMVNQQTKHTMSKSTSSLSFSTQSSASLTSTSTDEMSPKSRGGRRRRKRTIFSAADIEYLKEAFIQNPKPSQQDIAILSEQLGHDSYVIRVWFYNKRQATKKQNV